MFQGFVGILDLETGEWKKGPLQWVVPHDARLLVRDGHFLRLSSARAVTVFIIHPPFSESNEEVVVDCCNLYTRKLGEQQAGCIGHHCRPLRPLISAYQLLKRGLLFSIRADYVSRRGSTLVYVDGNIENQQNQWDYFWNRLDFSAHQHFGHLSVWNNRSLQPEQT